VVLKAILIGNSDGIGLGTTKRLLTAGWEITGISRSESPVAHSAYKHYVADVDQESYVQILDQVLRERVLDLCIYFVGIGDFFDPLAMDKEPQIINVNLTQMVRTAAIVIPHMVNSGQGHFIGISSLADELLSAEAPSYHASKAGFSTYLRSLAIALAPKGVQVTTVRFGFVDTKMAKGNFKPFMMSVEKAVNHLEHCIRKKPACYTAPKTMVPLIKLRKLMMKMGVK